MEVKGADGTEPGVFAATGEGALELEVSGAAQLVHSRRELVARALQGRPRDAVRRRGGRRAGRAGPKFRIKPRTVIGEDERQQIADTSQYPCRSIGSLAITGADGSELIGTGWLAGKRLVVTAGHCVYMHDRGGWAQRIEVTPGRNGSRLPYSTVTTSRFRSVTGWLNRRDRSLDYGALLLPEAIGDDLGYLGFASLSNHDLRQNEINIAGYPDDKPQAGSLWWQARHLERIGTSTLAYTVDTSGGQSGAPIWRHLNGSRQVVGIHGTGLVRSNLGVRINSKVFQNLQAWDREAG
ncbi:MAG: serine protease [bacterium]|nr:serine protease [bacterium]